MNIFRNTKSILTNLWGISKIFFVRLWYPGYLHWISCRSWKLVPVLWFEVWIVYLNFLPTSLSRIISTCRREIWVYSRKAVYITISSGEWVNSTRYNYRMLLWISVIEFSEFFLPKSWQLAPRKNKKKSYHHHRTLQSLGPFLKTEM